MGMVEDVRDFHRKFGQTIGEKPSLPLPDSSLMKFRLALIEEEYQEMWEALGHGPDKVQDFPKAVDGVLDLVWVLLGTLVSFGVDPRPAWNEIAKTNMAKEGGALRGDGKILKPQGWVPPDIETAIKSGNINDDIQGKTK